MQTVFAGLTMSRLWLVVVLLGASCAVPVSEGAEFEASLNLRWDADGRPTQSQAELFVSQFERCEPVEAGAEGFPYSPDLRVIVPVHGHEWKPSLTFAPGKRQAWKDRASAPLFHDVTRSANAVFNELGVGVFMFVASSDVEIEPRNYAYRQDAMGVPFGGVADDPTRSGIGKTVQHEYNLEPHGTHVYWHWSQRSAIGAIDPWGLESTSSIGLMPTADRPTLVAHEFGHVFGLRHPTADELRTNPSLSENLMVKSSSRLDPDRATLSAAQRRTLLENAGADEMAMFGCRTRQRLPLPDAQPLDLELTVIHGSDRQPRRFYGQSNLQIPANENILVMATASGRAQHITMTSWVRLDCSGEQPRPWHRSSMFESEHTNTSDFEQGSRTLSVPTALLDPGDCQVGEDRLATGHVEASAHDVDGVEHTIRLDVTFTNLEAFG